MRWIESRIDVTLFLLACLWTGAWVALGLWIGERFPGVHTPEQFREVLIGGMLAGWFLASRAALIQIRRLLESRVSPSPWQ